MPDIIGIDIGGTKCTLAKADMNGQIMSEPIQFATTNVHATLAEIYAIVDSLKPGDSPVFGIACGGPLDSAKGVVLSPPNLPGWDHIEIVNELTSRFGGKGYLMNDANACVLAEWQFGAGKGARHMVYLTHGTGMGGGLILNGQLYEGASGDAGEVGHIRLAPQGPKGYNKDGSAEGFCSGAGIARLAGIRSREWEVEFDGSESAARARAGDLTTKDIFGYVRAGDPFCTRVFKESAAKLATLLAYTIDILNPEVIVLGGVFMRNADLFMAEIEPILAHEALPGALKVCRIVPAGLSENVGDYAALAVANSL